MVPDDGLDAGLVAALLDAVRTTRRGEPPLAGFTRSEYARAHTEFETCSDQRDLIAAALTARLARRGDGPLSVLSVGCGDGSLDARVATRLVDAGAGGRSVRWVGIDPHRGSTTAFAAAMAALDRPSLHTEVHVGTFAEADPTGPFDAVVLVHSMYYVADVAATLERARALLAPGGEVVVVHAPRGALNDLVDLLAPPTDGHRQWFSDDVAAGFAAAGLSLAPVETLEAAADLVAAGTEALDFAVQARLTPPLRQLVRDYLEAVAVAGPDGTRRVPHPVDLLTSRAGS